MAAAFATLRPLPSPLTGLPRLPEPPFRRAVPTTPADRAGARVDCFPAHTAFPKWQEGRHPHCHFRGLLRLHTCYGPPDSRPRRPLSRGSSPSGHPAEPLVSYQINRQLSGWNLPPLMIRAFGAHGAKQTCQQRANVVNDPTRTLDLTVPRQFDILRSVPWLGGSDALPSLETPRLHRAPRRRDGVAARGTRAAVDDAGNRLPPLRGAR